MGMSNWWEQPDLVAENKQPGRATLWPALDKAQAIKAIRDPASSDQVICLDGGWRFKTVAAPEKTPSNFAKPDLKDKNWQQVEVPGCWQMQGVTGKDDQPIYTNVLMPWFGRTPAIEPPYVPKDNPTGLYRKTFTLPKGWGRKRVIVHFQGIGGAAAIFCNGQEVGKSKGSRNVAEFDLTPYVKAGRNVLAVQVIRWSDASYLEDQDQWRLSGLFRSVYLYATEQVYLQDAFIRPQLDETLRKGTIQATIKVGGKSHDAVGYSVRLSLKDPKGKAVWKKPITKTVGTHDYYALIGGGGRIELEAPVSRPQLWSSEAPQLYTAMVELLGPDGQVVEVSAHKIGFKRVEIKNRELLINGKAVLIRGVNRHDWSDEKGWTVDEDDMLADIYAMKQLGVNAVRTSHYPNLPRWYQLCDEYGLYVIDETDLESHHHYSQIAREPKWGVALLDRAIRMVERDKNHASIIGWSLGNETGYGANHDAMAGWIRHYDPSRILHNEPGIHEQGGRGNLFDQGAASTDLICPMYTPPETLIDWVQTSDDPRPVVLCEYAHAMGNSCGGLSDYWRAFETYHGLQGGFIWDWVDQGIATTRPDGSRHILYGGDFGERQHDRQFCLNGLVRTDRQPYPHALEFKKLIQPVEVEAASLGRGEVWIINKRDFTDLSDLTGRWAVEVNGDVVQEGKLAQLKTKPGARQKIKLPFKKPSVKAGEEAVLTLRFYQTKAALGVPKGHEVAWSQVSLGAKAAAMPKLKSKDLEIVKGKTIDVTGGDWTASFSEAGLVGLTHQGRSLLAQGPSLNLWRAPTDNDEIRGWRGQDSKPAGRWRSKGLHQLIHHHSKPRMSNKDGVLTIRTSHKAEAAADVLKWSQNWTIGNDGRLALAAEFSVPKALDDLPCLGLRLALPAGFEALDYFGHGPHESYSDRKVGVLLGRHTGTVDDQYVDYVVPQEHGNHTGVRWLSLASDRDQLTISAARPIEASASHYVAEHLEGVDHTYDLKRDDKTWVTLDAAQRGVGTASCGPDTFAPYRIGPGRYRLDLIFRIGGVS